MSEERPARELEGRVALVTGASRGIGRETALALGLRGARVAITYREKRDAAENVLQDLKSRAVEAMALQFDVADTAGAKSACERIEEAWSALDILVNNAGVTRDNLFIRMSDEEWDDVIRTNLRGAFALSRAVARGMMKRRRGRIINIASVSGLLGNVGQANYAASKMGLIGLTRSLARELAGRGITVNAVAPGFIETDMTARLPERARTELLQQIPLGRFGRAEEVAETVCFLASEKAAYITGQVVSVNGGLHM
ncbi:MAG: 3-oxoacyl-[acyl-carrier-protein] reductase [Nitrospirae bacterium]|nr:3-oxoacyl-[acyl-carrier-protein] reductase [Nitrospirota bacterium]